MLTHAGGRARRSRRALVRAKQLNETKNLKLKFKSIEKKLKVRARAAQTFDFWRENLKSFKFLFAINKSVKFHSQLLKNRARQKTTKIHHFAKVVLPDVAWPAARSAALWAFCRIYFGLNMKQRLFNF